MSTDHNEALSQLPHKLATLIRSLPQAPFRNHLSAECVKQAERIAELEAERDKWKSAEHALSNSYVRVRAAIGAICPPSLETAELWAYVEATALALTAERDQLRAEVERLKPNAERYEWLRSEHERHDPVCHLSWKLNNDRNSSEWVNTAQLDTAIDTARKATQ